jgi:hypothetical protein
MAKISIRDLARAADYVLAVKENQKTLYNNIKECFEGMESGR